MNNNGYERNRRPDDDDRGRRRRRGERRGERYDAGQTEAHFISGPRGRGMGFGPMPMGPMGPHGPMGPMGPMGRGPRRGRARRGDVRLAILSLLAEEPRNGYQIIQVLAERTQGLWRPSPGAIYPALSQLEDEGLIEAVDNAGQKAFQLTDAGAEQASGIEELPWEQVTAQSGGPEGAGAIWQEYGTLALAVKSVMVSGTAEQVKAATELLAETRRKLYAILAQDAQA